MTDDKLQMTNCYRRSDCNYVESLNGVEQIEFSARLM
jgi:hypothetical protein